MSLLSLLCAVAAFLSFGLATDEHHQRRFGRRPDPGLRRQMRIAGWLLVAAAFPFAVLASGAVFGPILWAGVLMLGAGIVFLALNLYAPRGPDRHC
ncbi:DUF3325 domain-containing protein [Sphingomonas sp. DG1-23]|uniref:DUF3325 domain-containing protein n=1 Tax=Sphingomonas sp. DG1-23 TaxID=3068316 RepID=UPI00273D16F3|nr:DUF3325 domain-containing protein [Sphingomonas sp. DG1-23]MDP5279374.1 DUF3325 domain-containing protein [Sphingomonas sp. DG1-23]